MKLLDKTRVAALAVFLGVASAAANATSTAIDVTAPVATITDQIASIQLVGAAVFGVVVIIKAWKWIRRAL
jgi:hypothetical protein